MYVRCFLYGVIENWNHEKIDDIPINAMTPWNPGEDNDFSIYKIKIKEKCNESNWIVLKYLADFFNKGKKGIDLFILDDDFLKKYNIVDDCPRLNCIHANIKNLSYLNYREFIEYTYKHRINQNIISYSLSDIKNVIRSLSSNDYKTFIDYASRINSWKTKTTIGKIKNEFFKMDEHSMPKYT